MAYLAVSDVADEPEPYQIVSPRIDKARQLVVLGIVYLLEKIIFSLKLLILGVVLVGRDAGCHTVAYIRLGNELQFIISVLIVKDIEPAGIILKIEELHAVGTESLFFENALCLEYTRSVDEVSDVDQFFKFLRGIAIRYHLEPVCKYRLAIAVVSEGEDRRKYQRIGFGYIFIEFKDVIRVELVIAC